MGKKLYIQDIVAIALLYNYQATKSHTLSLNEILNFYKVVSCNLDELNFNVLIPYPLVDLQNVCSFYINSKGERFCVLTENEDIKRTINERIYIMPKDVIKATKMDNALEEIGLENVDKIIKEKVYKKRTIN